MVCPVLVSVSLAAGSTLSITFNIIVSLADVERLEKIYRQAVISVQGLSPSNQECTSNDDGEPNDPEPGLGTLVAYYSGRNY